MPRHKIVGAPRALAVDDQSLWSFQARLLEAARRADVRAAVTITQTSIQRAADRIECQLGDHEALGCSGREA